MKTPEEIKQTIILGVITKELKSDIDITRQVNLAKAITKEYAAQCQADNADREEKIVEFVLNNPFVAKLSGRDSAEIIEKFNSLNK